MATLPQWIEARVIQKISTEAEWNEITLVPYKGEVCLVGDSGGKVVNIKIGDGVNTFPNLEYMFDSIQQNVGYIAIESNALPTPLDDVAWGMVSGGVYTFGGNPAFTVPDGHWGIANYSSGAWSLVDMGELPMPDVSDKLDRGGYTGTAQDLQDELFDLENSLVEQSDILFLSELSAVRFTSNTGTGSLDTAQEIIDEKTLRVSRVSSGATASCVYLDTGHTLSASNRSVSFRYKINSENIANSGVMLGYGTIDNIPSELPRGIVWRSGGSLFFIDPYSSYGTFPSQETYTIGDIVGIDYEVIYNDDGTNIIGGRFRLFKNGNYTTWYEDDKTYYGNVMIGFRGGMSYDASGSLENSANILNQSKRYTDEQISLKSAQAVFYVDNSGSSGMGAFSSPFGSFSDAINAIGDIQNVTIIARGGIYRESINLQNKTNLNLKIYNYNNESVKIFGSNQITGWTKTSGYNNIYQTSFTSSIPNQVRGDRRIFEHGRPSSPIPTDERHALQRGLSHHLPYTEISEMASTGTLVDDLSLLDTSENQFFINGGIMYIHITGGADPNTTGYSIENQARSILIPPFDKRNVSIEINFIQGYYSSNYGWDFLSFISVKRNNVASYGSRNNGFADDIGNTYAFMDISAGSGNDGASGHFNRRLPNYTGLDPLSGMNSNTYIDPWYVMNRDDGISHHVYGDGTGIGGLFEYNGKAGLIPANGANWRQYGGLSRKNALAGVFIGNAIGERSFAVVNVENFISENNPTNYRVSDDANWVLKLIKCRSANAGQYGYRCSQGKIIALECTTYNDANVQLAENGGVIEVINSGQTLI